MESTCEGAPESRECQSEGYEGAEHKVCLEAHMEDLHMGLRRKFPTLPAPD